MHLSRFRPESLRAGENRKARRSAASLFTCSLTTLFLAVDTFAAKCGHNGEEHNHNDIGSFILADDSGQLLVDLGCMEYTKENFGTQTRYTLLQNSSLGHSVPIIGGHPQKEGKEFFGKGLRHLFGLGKILILHRRTICLLIL